MTRPFLKRSVTVLPLLLWCLAMMTVLLLPFCAALLPQWRINWLPNLSPHLLRPATPFEDGVCPSPGAAVTDNPAGR